MRRGDGIRRPSSGPPGSRLPDIVVAPAVAAAVAPAMRRASGAERAQAWVGLSLVLGTTVTALYDTYLLASLVA
jgi:hypothetical protein